MAGCLLQDILENDEILLDANFKYSLTMDLVQVGEYIAFSDRTVHILNTSNLRYVYSL